MTPSTRHLVVEDEGKAMTRRIALVLSTAMLVVTLNAQTPDRSAGADLIVFNGKITTQNLAQPQASALAVTRGRIYSVGTDAEILSLKDGNTRLIDADGKRLIPGLLDAHVHVMNESANNYNVRWDGVPTLKRGLEMLSEQAQRTPDGHWVRVIGGWSPYQFKENRLPTMDELRKAVPNRPLIVQYAYNQAFLNDLAMKAFGVGTARFPTVPDTVFEKDAHGRETGVVHGYTWTFLAMEGMVPQPSREEQVSSLAYVINDLNRFAVTSVIDAGGSSGYPGGHEALESLIRDSRLNVRFAFVDLQFGDGSRSVVDTDIDAITKTSPISPRENMHPTMVHGHEYEGAGELLRVELHDHENFDMPAVIIDNAKLRRYVEEDLTKLVTRRIPFRMHISYNENITPFLDALEKVNRQTPLDGLRWSIDHAETISPDNIARVKALGGGIALDDKMALHGDGFAKTYSREKALQTPPLRRLVNSGVPLAMTTDGFRASSFNPWIGIGWMVSGKSVSGSEGLARDNRLSRSEALKLYTVGAAWFMQTEHEMGRIAPGNLADFALLSADYFTVPEDEIANISSVLTVVGGRVVFGTGKYGNLAPQLPEPIPAWSPVRYFGNFYGTK
jgi:predicted amidohydrolase YtcJ